LIKKSLVLIAPCAVLAAALFMTAGSSVAPADTTTTTFCTYAAGVPHTPSYCQLHTIKTVFCKVPNVVGKKLKNARSLLKKHNCKVGKVTFVPPKAGQKHRIVIKQKNKPGKIFAKNHKVNLKVTS
jgi:hypothetical protein